MPLIPEGTTLETEEKKKKMLLDSHQNVPKSLDLLGYPSKQPRCISPGKKFPTHLIWCILELSIAPLAGAS